MATITDDSYLSDYTGGQVDQSVKITSEWISAAAETAGDQVCVIDNTGEGTTKPISSTADGNAVASYQKDGTFQVKDAIGEAVVMYGDNGIFEEGSTAFVTYQEYAVNMNILKRAISESITETLNTPIDVSGGDITTMAITADLAMATGDMTLTPATGTAFSKVTITKPATMVSGNIKETINIGGVVGDYASNQLEEVSDSATLTALCIPANIGKVYKYTGTTDDTYTKDDIYEVVSG